MYVACNGAVLSKVMNATTLAMGRHSTLGSERDTTMKTMLQMNGNRGISMLTGLALGASLGAGVMYLMDPRMGRRRRALISDKVTSAGHKTTDAFDATWKDMRNRAQGMWASMTSSSPSRRGNMPRPQFYGVRMEWMQENWSPAARAIAIVTGGRLALSTARVGKGLGIVRFHANHDGSTTVNIKMSYNPPAGAIGYTIASLLGWDPKTMMDEDLARMKTMIETGKRPRDAAKRTRAAS